MPGFRGHIGFSIAVGSVFYGLAALLSFEIGDLVELPQVTGIFASLILFGLWPDVDTNSVGQDIFYPIFLVSAILLLVLNRPFESALVGIFSMLPTVGKHRGWTHEWWAGFAIPSLFLLLIPSLMKREADFSLLPYAVAGMAGYLGHLILDGEISLKKIFRK